MTEVCNEALFQSTHAALVYAYNFSDQQYAPPPMVRLMRGGAVGSGKGLVGIDGAGQAGLILAEVMQLETPSQAVLAARFSPHDLPCECGSRCCSGHKASPAWREAIDFLTEYVLKNVLSGCASHYRLRRAMVARLYGEKVTLQEVATRCGVPRDRAQDQNSKVSKHLQAVERRAFEALDARFKLLGLIPS